MLKQWQYCDLIYVLEKEEIIKARITGCNIDGCTIYYSPCSNHKVEYKIYNKYCFNTELEALSYLKSVKEGKLAYTIREINKHKASKIDLEKQISDIEDKITELSLCIN